MTSTNPLPLAGTESTERSNLPSLTGLRFVAALLVFFAHAFLLNNPLNLAVPINPYADEGLANGLAKVFAPAGFVGVSFFFVLSGFVLAWSSRPGERVQAFLRRRLLKIFPNHLVAWALVMVLFAAAYTPLHAWLPNLFLVHSWIPLDDTNSSVNVPAWSLCSELLFYLMFPFIIRPLMRIRESRLWWWAGGAVAAIAVVAVIARYVIPEGTHFVLAPLPLTQMWFAYLFPPSRMFEFILGILLARIVLAGRWPRIGVIPVLLLAVAGYTAVIFVPAPFNFVLVMVVPIAAIIGTAATADIRGSRSVLRTPLMVWLGTVSFGFYIIQAVPIFYGRLELFGGDTYSFPVATALLLGLFLATLFLGWLLYRFVEAPVMRRWSRSRRSTPPLPPVPGLVPAPSTGTTTGR
ncbi:acyltransferase family protein [Micromonospora sp. NPDC050397]|uniref:acyltransferase family protein n=1 Tax=Micromonospora sp. NPDC050397 TaxID=3364279 RepID=UPI00384DCF9E